MRDEVSGVIYESNKLVLLSFSHGVPCSRLRVHHKSRKSPVEVKEAFGTSEKVGRERV